MVAGLFVALALVSVEVWLWLLRQRKVELLEVRMQDISKSRDKGGSRTYHSKDILKQFEDSEKKEL